MTNQEITQLLSAVESQFPVETWTLNGVHVWPLVRYEVGVESARLTHGAVNGPAPAASLRWRDRFPARPALEIGRNIAGWRAARARDPIGNAALGHADLLLYSDGVSFVPIRGTQYERFVEPLAEVAEASGQTALLVSPLALYLTPRHRPSVFLQPMLDVARVLARGDRVLRMVRGDESSLRGFDEACHFARSRSPFAFFPDRAGLAALTASVRAYRAVHDRLLDRVRPSAVAVVSYYGLETMALLWAASARGIPTVDVQHGCINEHHWAYAGLQRLPAGGAYDLLPSVFAVWSEDEARVVEAWANRSGGGHRAFVVGNPFLDLFRGAPTPMVAALDEAILAEKAKAPGRKAVLYTAQGIESDEAIRHLTAFAAAASPDLQIWVRPHPVAPHDERLWKALADVPHLAARVDPPSDYPLYALLRHMDAHVTRSSSTILEAESFGVPSVILDAEEADMYRAVIDRGWAGVWDGGSDLVTLVRHTMAGGEVLRERDASRLSGSPSGRVSELLAMLLPRSS